MQIVLKSVGLAFLVVGALASQNAPAGPDHVDITWMSITNMYYELGPLRIVTDGYFTRLPEKLFYAGAGNVDRTHESNVVRWNHSGDPVRNALQHNPAELTQPPKPDPHTGGFRAGVAEDYPNGAGDRAFLFVVDGPGGRFSWFFHNSASAADLDVPIVLDGKNYGAPIENLRAAMKAAGIASVDLWIGAARADVARLVVPVLAPRAFLPVHWDGLWGAFEAGVTSPYADTALAGFLASANVRVVTPLQYMDKWRLDRTGIRAIPNDDVKRALGFSSR